MEDIIEDAEPKEEELEPEIEVELEPEKKDIEIQVKDDEEELPAHYNDDVYRDRHCDDDELRYQMIQMEPKADDEEKLYEYCDDNLEKRYRTVINKNKILPMEVMRKSMKMKLKKKNNKVREEIKKTIHDTFETFFPDKILTFICSSVELLFLERIKDMEREYTCVHKGVYYRMKMKAEYHKVRFGTSFQMVYIDIITSKFE